MYERHVQEGRPLLWRVKKGMLFMLLPAVAMGVAGFLVPPGSKTDDGFPLNYFFWGMAAFWALTDAVMLAIFSSTNRRRIDLLENGLAGSARIISAERTGTIVNGDPVIALRLEVNDGFRGLYETIHKESVPVEELPQLKPGSEIAIRASRTKKGKLLLLLK
jgi:hypothetical protein